MKVVSRVWSEYREEMKEALRARMAWLYEQSVSGHLYSIPTAIGRESCNKGSVGISIQGVRYVGEGDEAPYILAAGCE